MFVMKEEKESREEKRSFWGRLRKNKVAIAILLIVVVGLGYYFRGFLVAAVVNGKPISRISLIKELERQGGKAALDSLVTEALIEGEARKQGISVLPKEVDEEVAKIEQQLAEQGQDLNQVLVAQGMDRTDLAKQVRLQKLVEQIVGSEVAANEEEITKYLEDYGSYLSQDLSEEEKRARAKEQVEQQKLSEKFYAWLTEAKEKAKINYFVSF